MEYNICFTTVRRNKITLEEFIQSKREKKKVQKKGIKKLNTA